MSSPHLSFVRESIRNAVVNAASGLTALIFGVWVVSMLVPVLLEPDIGSQPSTGTVVLQPDTQPAPLLSEPPLSEPLLPEQEPEPATEADVSDTQVAEPTDLLADASDFSAQEMVPEPVPKPAPQPAPQPSSNPPARAVSQTSFSDAEVLQQMQVMAASSPGATGDRQPRFVLSSLASFEHLLASGGVLIARDLKNESCVAFGSSLDVRQARLRPVPDWKKDMAGYSWRVADLPMSRPEVQQILRIVLSKMTSFNRETTLLHVAIPDAISASLLSVQQEACRELFLPADDTVITAGHLSPGFGGGLQFEVEIIGQPSTGRYFRREPNKWVSLPR